MSEPTSDRHLQIWDDLKVLGEQHWVTRSFQGQGELNFEGTLRFSGSWKGSISAKQGESHLFLLKGATISGRILVPSLTVEGNLEDVYVEVDWVRVLPGGRIFGNVKAKKIILEEGALVQGRLYSENH
jgi:cytoskeletal protein CcmA (bactofilin family)